MKKTTYDDVRKASEQLMYDAAAAYEHGSCNDQADAAAKYLEVYNEWVRQGCPDD